MTPGLGAGIPLLLGICKERTSSEPVTASQLTLSYEKSVVASVIRQILRTVEFVVEDRDTAWSALREFEAGGADFTDCLIAHRNHARGCRLTYTFDRSAARGRHFAAVP